MMSMTLEFRSDNSCKTPSRFLYGRVTLRSGNGCVVVLADDEGREIWQHPGVWVMIGVNFMDTYPHIGLYPLPLAGRHRRGHRRGPGGLARL
jgi:hypothetical protein